MPLTLKFLGGVGTVTGSKHLLRGPGISVMVDCGLFQGFKQLRLRNWAPFPVKPQEIETIVLTHAHLDHSGYIPRLVKQGFQGQVLSTPATHDLCKILLRDSGHILEKDAEFANRHGFSKHKPALPLYTQADAEASLNRFADVPFDTEHRLGESGSVTFLRAGHILGAAVARITAGGQTIVFSGDLGRSNTATMLDPAAVRQADYLVLESTYGNRLHEPRDPEDALAQIIGDTAARGGSVIIPSFAVGRTQSLLLHLSRLKSAGRIPNIPVFLDSPMATSASELFCHHLADQRLTAAECREACAVAHYVRDVEESKNLDTNPMPKVIVSASGMATGGRVVHHLKRYAPDRRSTILFAGFQAGGTRGDAMTKGAETVKIHGQHIPVRAQIENLHMLSAHADADEIMAWLANFQQPPKTTFITHGEPAASDALRQRIEEELGWTCHVPEQGEEIAL
ncbi:MAG: MBL fold metallo-hydrolase [Proteobacteria bacterium]|nr:MBL fold metallo-hydrolase [Pseudomonadota bacterium]